MVVGERIRHQEVQLPADVVTALEERYIFFAKAGGLGEEKVQANKQRSQAPFFTVENSFLP
jgi:hypothetical protein